MPAGRRSGVVLVVALTIGLAGCTTLLGDFQIGGSTEAGLENSTLTDAASDTSFDAISDVAVIDSGRRDASDGGCAAGLTACGGACVSLSDIHTCGACGNDCTQLTSVGTTGFGCSGGRCSYGCAAGHADCADAGTGCGAALDSTSSCGGCGVTCSGATPVCAQSVGAPSGCAAACAAGESNCSGSCVTLATDPNHCGDCANVCSTAHATAACSGSSCAIASCATGYADCDKLASTGCEINTASDINNCGACGNACSQTHATAACRGSSCVITSCGAGYADCDKLPSTGCEINTISDINNCGACGSACNLPHATATCTGSSCSIGSCAAGYADCDGVAANGCETDLSLPANCGGCNTPAKPTACSGGAPVCSVSSGGASRCVTGCQSAAPTLCNGTKCVDTASDPNNCGGCGAVCSTNHAAETCTGSRCAVSSCTAGYADCDQLASTGCEVDTTSDINHCGSCAGACSTSHATEVCTGSSCTVVSCGAGYADCDRLASNGCEVTTTSDVNNCGSCGSACSTNHATETCTGSACSLLSCAAGFADCDSLASTGCEINTTSDTNHCGTCGHGCTGGETCQSGVCACASGQVLCGTPPTCVDEQTDGNQCGACGHSCLGGACSGGLCQRFQVASFTGNGDSIALDALNMYFLTSSNNIYSCSKTGCGATPTLLATGLQGPSVLYDPISTDLFVDEQANNLVAKYTTSGSLLLQVTGQAQATGLAADANFVYCGGFPSIFRFSRDGATQSTLASATPGAVVALALNATDTTIYGAVEGATASQGRIISSSLSNTSGAWSYFVPQTFPQLIPEGIVVANGNVYWINLGTTATSGDGGVFMCAASGCTQPVSAIGGLALTYGATLVADATNLYFIGSATLYRCALPSCPGGPTALSSGSGTLNGSTLAQDATALYWLDEFGAAWKLAK
jgi:hypothetical protein